MRLFGHPVHPMLVHFPIAFWPAHWALQAFGPSALPAGGAAVGRWLVSAGCALGWLSACAGGLDLAGYWRAEDQRAVRAGLVHAVINGSALFGFTVVSLLEWRVGQPVYHGRVFLGAEAVLLVALFVGNHFGGRIRWAGSPN